MSVVYYANYFVWFEVARTELLRNAGWTYLAMESDGFFLPVIEARCHYRKPARYDDDVEVLTRGVLESPVRVRFEYAVTRQPGEVVLASGYTVHASMSRSGRPRRLPDRVCTILEAPQSRRSRLSEAKARR